jgi:hypothetical protein
MRGGRRPKAVSVIEEPRSLTSRVLRREPSATPVIEEPRQFSLRTLWDRRVSEPADAKRWRRQVTVASSTAAAVVFILDIIGVIDGFAAHTLVFALGAIAAAVEKGRRKRRWSWRRKQPVDRR